MATKAANRSVATAMAISGRVSRACDVCAKKSARWYCAADEAYLCEHCDTQVHSANSLALRHERVRLSPNGTPMKLASKSSSDLTKKSKKAPEDSQRKSTSKQLHAPPVQVLPSRKRSRTSRPHPHHLKSIASIHGPQYKPPKLTKVTEDAKVKAEPLFDFLDTEDFLTDGTQEVPTFITVMQDSPSGSEVDLDFDLSPGCHSGGFHGGHSASSDSFAAYFKGKAAHAQVHDDLSDDKDQFLVPDAFNNCLDSPGIDVCCDIIDGGMSLGADACFVPGDIPGLDGFEDFGCSRNLSDDYSLSFDLALRGGSEAFEGDGCDTSETGAITSGNNGVGVESDQFVTAGPFAKFFAGKVKTENQPVMSAETIKSEAKEILRCCLEGLSEEDLRQVPSLRLNYEDVMTAWSDRGEPWLDGKRACGISHGDTHSDDTGNDAGLVPDMGQGADDGQSGGGREASVLRYKEKRRTRLFSKKIRYEVRKLNAERRPRMKGRFVKRTNNS